VPVEAVAKDLSALTLWSGHRFLAGPEYPFEVTKIGGGPAPLRVPEGWLLLHHGRLVQAQGQALVVGGVAGGDGHRLRVGIIRHRTGRGCQRRGRRQQRQNEKYFAEGHY